MPPENHTGKELELMLAGAKPLSMFYDDADTNPESSLIPEADFDLLVEQRGFKKGVRVFELAFDPRTGRRYRMKSVLYALPGEEWRIPAMFLVTETLLKLKGAGRDEAIERMTGALLGYTGDQIEAYVQKLKEARA
jgi:hypothetical protein